MTSAQFFRLMRTAGFIIYIPIVLFAGPFAGFYIGEFIKVRYGLTSSVLIITVAIGFIAAAFETARILRLIIRSEKGKPDDGLH
jgi:hypothetical protein